MPDSTVDVILVGPACGSILVDEPIESRYEMCGAECAGCGPEFALLLGAVCKSDASRAISEWGGEPRFDESSEVCAGGSTTNPDFLPHFDSRVGMNLECSGPWPTLSTGYGDR